MGITKKQTIEGTEYLKVVLDSGSECILRLHEDDVVSPSTIRSSDFDELYQACELAEANGYTVNLDYGLTPSGFSYP